MPTLNTKGWMHLCIKHLASQAEFPSGCERRDISETMSASLMYIAVLSAGEKEKNQINLIVFIYSWECNPLWNFLPLNCTISYLFSVEGETWIFSTGKSTKEPGCEFSWSNWHMLQGEKELLTSSGVPLWWSQEVRLFCLLHSSWHLTWKMLPLNQIIWKIHVFWSNIKIKKS